MRIAKRIGMMLLTLCLLTGAARAETLTVYGFDTIAEEVFTAEHPGVVIARWDYRIDNTEVTRYLMTGEMKADVMTLYPDYIDVANLADKGYLADLSASDYLMAQSARMYKPLQDVVMRDGKLYGIPSDNYVRSFVYNPAGWQAAGYAEEDLPGSFPELLDFLEAWCDRVEEEPNDDVSVFSYFDATLYSEISYTRWLTELLLDQHLLQTDYAGKPLRFDGAFLELLRRIETLGPRLYRDEVPMVSDETGDTGMGRGAYQLFDGYVQFISQLPYTVPLRLDQDDPILIRGQMVFKAIPAVSEARDLAIDYLEAYMRCVNGEVTLSKPEYGESHRHMSASLFRDAEPLESPSGQAGYEAYLKEIETMKEQLASGSLTGDERVETEDRLARYESSLSIAEKSSYIISPQEVALWQQYGDMIYYPGPSAFDLNSDGNQNVSQLLERFYYGHLTADQLCGELNRIAEMIELERQ